MARPTCAVSDIVLERSIRGVRIENDSLSATVLIDKGADIFQLVYKPRAIDVLWKSPRGLKPPGHAAQSTFDSEAAWLEHYAGGWQVLFPNGGNACIYKGAPLNFHGEASVIPWAHEVVRTGAREAEVRFSARLFRSPFVIERTLRVERGRPALILRERITNLGAEAMEFMWSHHPAFGAPFLSEHCIIDTSARTVIADDAYVGAANPLALGARSAWPLAGGVDLSRVPGPQVARDMLGYLADFDAGWYAITNTRLGFGVGLAWSRAVFPYAWLWQEMHANAGFPWYKAAYVMAIEPATSFPGQGLDAVMRKTGTQRRLDPGESAEMEMCAVFYDSARGVESIAPDGAVAVRRA